MAKVIRFCCCAFLFSLICAVIGDQNNTLTFKWYDDVVAETVKTSEHEKNPAKHLVEDSTLHKHIKAKLTLQATNFTTEYPDTIAWTQTGGFVDTVFHSYRNHHNIIIRPDDIWTAILVQFSFYVNANAEALRHSFVNFEEGKMELQVKFVAPLDQIPIDEFITKIVGLITENIDPSIYHWISPNFTTTTENDKLTAGVALMATVQNYFEYGLWSVLCGIPQLTIEGDEDDWREIRKRVDRLKDFELSGRDVMTKWSSMLGKILDQFISVKEGNNPDKVFWKQALRIDYKMLDMGCAQVKETYLNGWITAFSAFDKLGTWQGNYNTVNSTQPANQWLTIRTDFITPGIVYVPIQIYDEHAEPEERNYTGAIVTGHMGYAVKRDLKTIQSLSGWAMVITKNVPWYLSQRGK